LQGKKATAFDCFFAALAFLDGASVGLAAVLCVERGDQQRGRASPVLKKLKERRGENEREGSNCASALMFFLSENNEWLARKKKNSFFLF
jgi:hypothetical protein